MTDVARQLVLLVSAKAQCLSRMEALTRPLADEIAKVHSDSGLSDFTKRLEKVQRQREGQLKIWRRFDGRFKELLSQNRQRNDVWSSVLVERVSDIERKSTQVLKRIEVMDQAIGDGVARLVTDLNRALVSEQNAVTKVRKFKSSWVEMTGEGLDTKL